MNIRKFGKNNLDNSAIRAGFWFVVCNIIQRGIQFLYTPIYSRVLSTDGYGKFSSFLAWESILAVFATLNLSNAVFNKGMVKYDGNGNRFAYAMYGLAGASSLITAVIFGIIYCFTDLKSRLSYAEFILLFIVMYFKMAIQIWSSEERYNFRYKALLIVTIISSVLNPLFSLFFFSYILHDYSSMEIGYAMSLFIVGIILIISSRHSDNRLYKKEYWRYAISFVAPLIPHYVANVILYQSDRLMIGYYCDDSSVGLYTLAYQLALATSIVFTAVNNALVPWLYRKIKDRDYAFITNVVLAMVMIVLIISVGLVLVAPELILILGSSEFASAVVIVAPIAVSTVLMFVNTLVLDVLFYFEKNKIIMIATVMGAITNLILNYLFIPRMGFEIAAYTTVIGYAVILLVNLIDLINIKVPFTYFDLRSGAVLVLGIIACFGVQKLFELSLLIRWTFAGAMCIVSLVIFYKRYYMNLKRGEY